MLVKLLSRMCATPVASCIRREELCLALAAVSKLYPIPLAQCNALHAISQSRSDMEEQSTQSTNTNTNASMNRSEGENCKEWDAFTKTNRTPETALLEGSALLERVRRLLPMCTSREVALVATGLAALSLHSPSTIDLLIRHLYLLCESEARVLTTTTTPTTTNNNNNNYSSSSSSFPEKISMSSFSGCNLSTLTTMIQVALLTGHKYNFTLKHLILHESIKCVKLESKETRNTILRFISAAKQLLPERHHLEEIETLLTNLAEATKMDVSVLREAITYQTNWPIRTSIECEVETVRQRFAQMLWECEETDRTAKRLSFNHCTRVLELMLMYASHTLDDPCALQKLESISVNVFLRSITVMPDNEQALTSQKEEQSQEPAEATEIRRELWALVNKHTSIFHRLRHTIVELSVNTRAKINRSVTDSNEANENEIINLHLSMLKDENANTMQPVQVVHRAYEDMCHGVAVHEGVINTLLTEYWEEESAEAMAKSAALFAELSKIPDGLVYKLYSHLSDCTLRSVSALLRAVRRDMTCSLTKAVEELLEQQQHTNAEMISRASLNDLVELLDVLAMPLPRAFELPKAILKGEAQLRSMLLTHLLNTIHEMRLTSLLYITAHAQVLNDTNNTNANVSGVEEHNYGKNDSNNNNEWDDVLLTLTCKKLELFIEQVTSIAKDNCNDNHNNIKETLKLSLFDVAQVVLACLHLLTIRDYASHPLLKKIAEFTSIQVKAITHKYSNDPSITKLEEEEKEEHEEFILLLTASMQVTLDAWELHEPMRCILHLVECHLQTNSKLLTLSESQESEYKEHELKENDLKEVKLSSTILLTAGLIAWQEKHIGTLQRIQAELACNTRVEQMTEAELKYTLALLQKCEAPDKLLVQQLLHRIWHDASIRERLERAPSDQLNTFVKHTPLNTFSVICTNEQDNRIDLLKMCEEFGEIVHESLAMLHVNDIASLLATCARAFVLEGTSKDSTPLHNSKRSVSTLSSNDIQVLQEVQTYLHTRLRACSMETYITLCKQSYRCEHFLTIAFTDHLLTLFPRVLDYLNSTQISEALFGFGEMSNAGQRLPHQLATADSVDYVVDNVNLFWSGTEIAKLLHGFAKLHCTKRNLYSVFAQKLWRRAVLFTLDRPSMSLVLHAFGLVKFIDKELIDRFTRVCRAHATEMNAADLLLVVKSHSRMMLWNPNFYRFMGKQVIQRAHEFPVQALCELFAAFGNVQLHDNVLAESLLSCIVERMDELPSTSCAVEVLVSMWQMGATIEGDEKITVIADYIVAHPEQLNSSLLVQVCTVVNDVAWSYKPLINAIADQSVKLKMLDQITPEAGRAVLDVLSQNMIHHEAARNELSKLARSITKEAVLLSDSEVQELQAMIAR